MLLSIIIVNYNVKYFLEQCLCSVEKSLRSAGLQWAGANEDASALPGSNLQAEVFVVDNHSTDGSAEWLPTRFPHVRFLLNPDNTGFAVANNQALAQAKGKYILFLNPDTILPEDALSTCVSFMEAHPDAGAASLRMIDGGGRFLKESRRGFPSPWVAFCKLAGLTRLFPRSSLFAQYYLGHLPAAENHPAPVLPGAYMFVRKQALDKTGGFDERFFLYAEDIDLSYRIGQAGYTNYYLADATILHFKGESTKKDARYIKQFYKAMSQFRRKHFRSGGSMLFNFGMEAAIWLRGGMEAAISPMIRRSPTKKGAAGAHLWVGGDAREAGRIKEILSARNTPLATDPGRAGEIIFCEGEDFSFKAIIAEIVASQQGPYMIHAAGTAAAVGSPCKEKMGTAIILL